MTKNHFEDLESNACVLEFLNANQIEIRTRIVKSLGTGILPHVHFVSQLYALGESHDRSQYRKILSEMYPLELSEMKERDLVHP